MESLDDLLDIAAVNAIDLIRIEEDKEFLRQQKLKGRPGSMIGVDTNLAAKEKRSCDRLEEEESRKRKHQEISQQSGKFHTIYNIGF